MKDIEKLISPLIESQFPDIYKDEGQNLIAFVKAYFEWMEDTNGVLYDSRRLPDYRDIDKTVDEFIDQFRKKYMYGIPRDAVVDKRILQKHIKEVYAAKGTTRGLQLLFRLLYNEDVEVYLPGDDILKASDGRWYVPKYLEMEYNDTLPLYVGKIITGRVSGATAYVRDYQLFYIGSRRHDILYLEDLVGNFSATEEILNQEIIDDLQINITESPRVIGSMTSIEITSSEPGFTLGEVVTVNDTGFYGKAVVTGVKKLNGSMDFNIVDGGNGFTITPGSDVTVTPAPGDTPDSPASFEVGSITDTTTIPLTLDIISPAASIVIGDPAPAYTAFSSNPTANVNTPFDEILEVNEYTYGKIASLANIDPGDGYGANATVQVEDTLIYPLRIPDGNGGFFGYNANIEAIAGFGSGAIANVVVYDSGVGYTNGSIVTILSDSNTSIQALGVVTSDRNGVGTGYFSDSKGFLNSDKFVHDNFFYQDYSYQVKANLALNKYAGVLRDLWHPSGIERFGKIIVKDEYKSRGTTVEALMEWLESVEVTVSTNRFTSTSFATTLSTNYLTTTSRGTQYETERLTEYTTTFLTNISYTTTFDTTTIVDAATAIVVSRDTIKYISTSLNTLAERDTTTLISTAKTPATVTALSTVYATITSPSTTTTYNTFSAIGFTSYVTSTTTTTGTVFVTTVSKNRETDYLTAYSTVYYDELNPTSDDGFLSEAAAQRAYEDLGFVEPEWSCSVYEYGPVFGGGYRYAYICYPLVSTSTTRITQKQTVYGTTEGAYRLTSTTKSTDTTVDLTTAKSTSRSTTTSYSTDTTVASFRLTTTSINADTAYITSTVFERLTTYDTLPVRSTQTNRLSSTVFSTTYSTGMGFTTIDTSKDTSAITTTKYSTISSTKVATLTSYISTKTTAFDTTFATGIGFTTVETSKSTSFLADITKYQTSRDTQIVAGTQLITSIDTDKLVVYGTNRFTSYLTQYYDTSSDTNKSTDTTILTSFDTYKLTSVKTYFLTSNITTIATEYLTAKETNLLTDTEFSTTINTMTTVLTRVFTATYNTKFDTYTNTTTSFNTNRITTTNINSATMFETSLVTESATAFLTDTNYITIYSTEYRTVTYTDISTSFSTSKATQLYTTTSFDTIYSKGTTVGTSRSTATRGITNAETIGETFYDTNMTTKFSTSTIFDTTYDTNKLTSTIFLLTETSTNRSTSKLTQTTDVSGTIFSTSTTFNTTYNTNVYYDVTTFVTSKETAYSTNKSTSTTINSGTALITSVDTDTVFDTIIITNLSTEP